MSTHINLEQLISRKAKDYTFTILFFIIFSFFTLFVIRPNIVTVFGLQKELTDLQILDKDYEAAIVDIVSLQSVLEKNRDRFPMLREALPYTPQVNQVIDDIRNVASESGIDTEKIDINQISLKESENKSSTKAYNVNIETRSDFPSAFAFVDGLTRQRRLKTLKNIKIYKEGSNGTGSAVLRVILEVEGYYL